MPEDEGCVPGRLNQKSSAAAMTIRLPVNTDQATGWLFCRVPAEVDFRTSRRDSDGLGPEEFFAFSSGLFGIGLRCNISQM